MAKTENDNEYTLYYLDEMTKLRYALTRVNLDREYWLHTETKVLSELWPHLQKIHEELLMRKIDLCNLSETQDFQEKVARAYWLGCNLMRFLRGNAQYCLMWLSAIFQYHGLDPLSAKRETPMPDCLAISLPLADFIHIFPSLFENPLSEAILKP